MEKIVDYIIEPFKYRKYGTRSDKGRTHNYPKL